MQDLLQHSLRKLCRGTYSRLNPGLQFCQNRGKMCPMYEWGDKNTDRKERMAGNSALSDEATARPETREGAAQDAVLQYREMRVWYIR